MIEIIKTTEALAALKTDWERTEANPQLRIFQTFRWNYHVWVEMLSKVSGNRLFVIRWHQQGLDYQVILPTYLDRKGTLRFIKDDSCDTCDAVYPAGVNLHIAFREMAETIRSEPEIRGVWLQKLLGDSTALNSFGVLLRGAFVNRDNASSWLTVPQTDDFIKSQTQLRSKDRSDLKALYRHSSKYTLQIASHSAGNEFPAEEIRRIRDSMICSRKRGSGFFPEEQIAFSRRLYETDGCDVALLYENGRLQALNLLLKKGDRVLSWDFFYEDPRTSTALYVKYLCEIKRKADSAFDFGIGVYSYKIGTFRPHLAVSFSLRYGKSVGWNIRALIAVNVRHLKDYVKTMLHA